MGGRGEAQGRERRSERVKKILKQQTSLLESKLFCRETPQGNFLSLCFREFFPGILFLLFFSFWAGRGRSSLPLSFSCFLFGSLTRPPTPSGFQEHPEDVY